MDPRGRPTERDGLRIRDEVDGQHQFSSFLTTEANATVARFAEAMPVILTTRAEVDTGLRRRLARQAGR